MSQRVKMYVVLIPSLLLLSTLAPFIQVHTLGVIPADGLLFTAPKTALFFFFPRFSVCAGLRCTGEGVAGGHGGLYGAE